MNITRRLAEFVSCTPPGAIGEDARVQARRAILDTLGVALAGTREDAGRIAAEMVGEQGGREEASVLGQGFRVPAPRAALANGTAAHALDYDDVSVNMRGHPSVPLFPAVLALGEKAGSSGREVIEAFVIGFEVECKLGRAIGGPHYALGWHATSTFGTVGAAAACSRLLRLDIERTQAALAISASLASGLRQNFGTMTKPLHAGWCAHNGVIAADLASRGMTADAMAIEGENGFLRAMSGGAGVDPTAAVRNLGEPWEIVDPGIGVKLYPCCYATHRAIDAALEVREGTPADSIEVVVSPGTLSPLISRLPETGLEAKFSMEYCVAAALVDGNVTLACFTDEAVARPEVRSLMERVRVRDDGEPMQFPIGGVAEVMVSTGERSRSARVDTPRGDPKNPVSWEGLAQKFRECAGLALPAASVERTLGVIERLDGLPNIRELTSAVS